MIGRMHSRNGGINVENLTLVEAEFNETLAHVDNAAPAEGVASTLIMGVVEEDVGTGVDARLGALDKGVGVEGLRRAAPWLAGNLSCPLGDQSLVIITIIYT